MVTSLLRAKGMWLKAMPHVTISSTMAFNVAKIASSIDKIVTCGRAFRVNYYKCCSLCHFMSSSLLMTNDVQPVIGRKMRLLELILCFVFCRKTWQVEAQRGVQATPPHPMPPGVADHFVPSQLMSMRA